MRTRFLSLGMALPLLTVAAVLLAACADPDPLWSVNTPKNGAGEYVTARGIPIPGSPMDMGGPSE